MVRHTDADDARTETYTAAVFHAVFADPDDDEAAFELGRDLRMGFEWCDDRDIDPSDADVVDTAYTHAGTVDVDVADDERPEAVAYSAWEAGAGHDPSDTRSMSVGDVIVIDRPGDAYGFFVDRIGFEEIDVSSFPDVFGDDDQTDEDDDRDDDAIEAEARDFFGDETVDEFLSLVDDREDAIDDMAAEMDRRDGDDDRDPYDMTPTDAEIAEAFGVDDVDEITDDMVDDAVPETPERVDVSSYKTAAGAAKKTAEVLREWADFMGYDPDAVTLWDRETTAEKRGDDAWCVAWEGGPHEWAIAATGGESITAFAGPRMTSGTTPEVAGLTSGDGWVAEPHYSFDILFFNR